ncbi:protein kinase domain-containing protein 10 [Elsinoe australis]|uniref:Protein kinase domain-containing protein 10 n=1 Tax=Elsinoe australis TaxID=40998 RepID=A0A4U7B3T4_9PEZI|nr:protein kinase domain-containing protein 10 [Elsinoe australis]
MGGIRSYTNWAMAASLQRGSLVTTTIKICTAESSTGNSQELQVMGVIQSIQDPYPGRSHIRTLLDDFRHDGPNGSHTCLVVEVLGQAVCTTAEEDCTGRRLPPRIASTVASQVSLALSFLHRHSIAHGAFSDTKIQRLTESEVLQYVGEPELWPITSSDGSPRAPGVPRYHVWPLASAEPDLDDEPQVKLLDFGNSFFSDQPPANLSVPMSYCPPEVALGVALDHRVDFWALGCLIFDLYCGQPPFDDLTMDHAGLIEDVTSLLGPLPGRWRHLRESSGLVSEKSDGWMRRYSLQEWLEACYYYDDKPQGMSDGEVKGLGAVTQRLLVLDPERRAAASEISKEKFFLNRRDRDRSALERFIKVFRP